MEYRPLGRTGVQVSKLCLGTMMFGAWGNTDHDDSIRIIHAARDGGINFVDSADVYSAGESEEIVGKALKGRRDDVVLATKFWGQMDNDPNRRGVSRRWIIAEVENSLRRLGTDWIDLYQMHRPDPQTDIDETLGALTDLVRQGKVPLHRLVLLLSRRDRRGTVDRSRPASGALPYRAATLLAARSLGRARRAAHGPAPRHGHPHLQPARRRLALGQLDLRQHADLPGPATTGHSLRHVNTREPAQARGHPAARQGCG
jgi:Aldo/keto reductase family